MTALSPTLSVRKSWPGFIDSLYVRQVIPAAVMALNRLARPTMLWLAPPLVQLAGGFVNGELASPGWVLVGSGVSCGALAPVASQFHWLSSMMPQSSAPPSAV